MRIKHYLGKVCGFCGEDFSVEMADKTRHFCSRVCYKKFCSKFRVGVNNPFYGKKHEKHPCGMLGKKHTIVSKLKMSNSRRGKKFTESHRKALSDSRTEYLFSVSKLSKDNKKMLRKRLEYKLWRESVFNRDDYTCKKCGKRGGYIEAHHIKSWTQYPKLRYETWNGQALCIGCHKLENQRQMMGNKNGFRKPKETPKSILFN